MREGSLFMTYTCGKNLLVFPKACFLPPGPIGRLHVPGSSMRPSGWVLAKGMWAEVMHVTSSTTHNTLPCLLLHSSSSVAWCRRAYWRSSFKDGGVREWQVSESLHHQLKEKCTPIRNTYFEQKWTLISCDPLYIWGMFVTEDSIDLD